MPKSKSKSKRTRRMEIRKRAQFLDRHAERIRLALIGGGAIVLASIVAKVALG
jgi:hypothetical protein